MRKKKRNDKKHADEAVVARRDANADRRLSPELAGEAWLHPRVDVRIARWKKKSFFG